MGLAAVDGAPCFYVREWEAGGRSWRGRGDRRGRGRRIGAGGRAALV